MNYQEIIDHFYPEHINAELRQTLMIHSQGVAALAREICQAHPELKANEAFVYEAAMLHDIGIVRCDAPGIHCHGNEHYLRHGVVGAEMLHEYAEARPTIGDIEPYARVCSHHTGTGLTAKAIRERQLPLPEVDLRPETIEEQIVCYADKFYSKTRPEQRKTFEQAERSLMKFGEEGLEVFRGWHRLFAID